METEMNEALAEESAVDTGVDGAFGFSDRELALEMGLDPADFEVSVGENEDAELERSLSEHDDDVAAEDVADAVVEEAEAVEEDVRDEDPEWFQRRIDKIVKRERQERDALRLELEELRSKVERGAAQEAVKQGAAEGGAGDALKQLRDAESVEREWERWDDLEGWAFKHRDGVDGVDLGDGKKRDYSAGDVSEIFEQAKAMKRKLGARAKEIAVEQQQEQLRSQVTEVARREHPYLFDKESVEVQALSVLPDEVRRVLVRDPNGLLLLGAFAEGMKVSAAGKRVLAKLRGESGADVKKPGGSTEAVRKHVDRLKEQGSGKRPAGGPQVAGRVADAGGAKRSRLAALEAAAMEDHGSEASISRMLDAMFD